MGDQEKWPPLAIPFTDLIAGSAAGAAQVIVGQPLDTIKTRAQTSPSGMFKGPMDILAQTVRKEGFFALYKGENSTCYQEKYDFELILIKQEWHHLSSELLLKTVCFLLPFKSPRGLYPIRQI